MMSHIVVVGYDPSWPSTFESEATRLREALDGVLLEIHHVGSTAVPDLPAKPVIDMLAVVRDHEELDTRNPQMRSLGYTPRGEFHIPGRRYFTRGADEARTHHLHAYVDGHHRIHDHLLFRDYLRAHAAEAAAYAALKQRLTLDAHHDIEAYCAGKEGLIRELIAKAWRWDAAGRSP